MLPWATTTNPRLSVATSPGSRRYSPEDIEAVRPDGFRIRRVMLLGGRRLGFEEPVPVGTQIFRRGTLMWVVR